jgi:small subunit ribosomal protein S3
VGHKVNPISFRLGVYRNWDSRWFPRDSSTYAQNFFEDIAIRKFFNKYFASAEIERIEIEKTGDAVRVIAHSARPGVLIGKKGQEMDAIRKKLAEMLKRGNVEVSVQEVKNPEVSAQLLARSIADQLERRGSHKKAMKKAASGAMRAGAQGVKIRVAGRVGGAEIARDEWLRIGRTPLHTLRADVDYGFAEAMTTYGKIGVKVWVCHGEYKAAARE